MLSIVVAVGVTIATIVSTRARRAAGPEPWSDEDRQTWRMPSFALLSRPVPSLGRQIALYGMRGYLVLAVVLLLVKAIQLATGH